MHVPREGCAMDLFADRFVVHAPTKNGLAFDLATNRSVWLRVGACGGDAACRHWTSRCDELFRTADRKSTRLLDYGLVGQAEKFEAWSRTLDVHEPWIDADVREAGDASAASVETRPAITALAELFDAVDSRRGSVAALWGRDGSDLAVAVLILARLARTSGFVPVSAHALARYRRAVIGRSVFLIDDGTVLMPHVRITLDTPLSHVCVRLGPDEQPGIHGVSLGGDSRQRYRRQEARRSEAGRVRRAGQASRVEAVFRVAEQPASYGDRDDCGSRTADCGLAERTAIEDSERRRRTCADRGELPALRRRFENSKALLAAGRHAPGLRLLRQAVGSLARREAWTLAADGLLRLATELINRGRPRDALRSLSEAAGYAERAGDPGALLDVARLTGESWIDAVRLDEGERVLSAALTSARATGDRCRELALNTSLARCLFWRAEFAAADTCLTASTDPLASEADAVRRLRMTARVAVARGQSAAALAALDEARARVSRGSELTADVEDTSAFVKLVIGDYDGVDRHVAACLAATLHARHPTRTLSARLLQAEADRRRSRRLSEAASRTLRRLSAAAPPLLRARWILFSALCSASDADVVVSRQVAHSGLKALDLVFSRRARGLWRSRTSRPRHGVDPGGVSARAGRHRSTARRVCASPPATSGCRRGVVRGPLQRPRTACCRRCPHRERDCSACPGDQRYDRAGERRGADRGGGDRRIWRPCHRRSFCTLDHRHDRESVSRRGGVVHGGDCRRAPGGCVSGAPVAAPVSAGARLAGRHAVDGRAASRYRTGRERTVSRAHRRRERKREGTRRAGDPPTRCAARPAVLHAELRGAARRPGRGRAVRPRARRLHRRGGRAARSVRRSARRYAVPRRGRRALAAGPGEAAARDSGRRTASRRRERLAPGRRPDRRGDQPRSAARSRTPAGSDSISCIASTSSASRCRRCATAREDIAAARRSLLARGDRARRQPRHAGGRDAAPRWRATTGRATSANCRTCWPHSRCRCPKRGVVPPTALAAARWRPSTRKRCRLQPARRRLRRSASFVRRSCEPAAPRAGGGGARRLAPGPDEADDAPGHRLNGLDGRPPNAMIVLPMARSSPVGCCSPSPSCSASRRSCSRSSISCPAIRCRRCSARAHRRRTSRSCARGSASIDRCSSSTRRFLERRSRAAISARLCARTSPSRAPSPSGMPATFELALAAMLVAVAIAIPLGNRGRRSRATRPSITRRRRWRSSGISMPNFWLGPLLAIVFSVALGWLPGLGPRHAGAPGSAGGHARRAACRRARAHDARERDRGTARAVRPGRARPRRVAAPRASSDTRFATA